MTGVEIRKADLGIVIGKLLGPAEVGFYGALAQTFELDEGGVMLIPLGGDEVSIN